MKGVIFGLMYTYVYNTVMYTYVYISFLLVKLLVVKYTYVYDRHATHILLLSGLLYT